MTFLISVIILFSGTIVSSFTISNIILILFFAIPFTKKLEKIKLLKNNDIINSYIIALVIQVLILIIPAILFYIFLSDKYFISLIIGYAIGIIGILTKIKEFGLNMNNFSDYFEKNKTYFWEEIVNKYENNKENFYNSISRNLQ